MSEKKYPVAQNWPRGTETLEELAEPSLVEIRESRERTVSRLRLLWDRRGWLFRVTLWSVLLSVIAVFLIPKRYEAATRLMPPDSQSGTSAAMLSVLAGKAGGGIGGIAGDLLGVKNSGALFTGILQSRTVEDRLIQQFDLKRVYGNEPMEDLRKDLAEHTAIAEDRKSGILTIIVTDHDPKRAAAMASAYVTELDRLVAEVSTSSARRERIFLEERLQAVKQELDASAGRFSEFASKNTAIDIPTQGKAMVEAAARLQGELIAAESELRGLEAVYTDQNVRVRALRARVGELHSQLEKLGGNSADIGSARNDTTTMYPSIRKLPLLGVKYADLFRQTKIQETVFELLTQQYELAKVQEAKEIPSVRVLDVAVVPTKKSYPPRVLMVFGATIASLLLACAWLFSKGFWNGIEPQEPGKRFILEIAESLDSDLARLIPAGSSLHGALARVGLRLGSPSTPLASPEPQHEEERTETARAASTTGA